MVIILIANEIREYYQKQKDVDGIPTLDTPDAIHIATAIWLDEITGLCRDVFTFDGCRPTKRDKKRREMIPLSGNIAGKYRLIIRVPSTGMHLFNVPDKDSKEEEDTDGELN